MVVIVLSVLLLVLLAIIVFLIFQSNKERNQLIAALIAKSLPEYTASMERLKTSPKDKLKQMKAENDLAIANEKLLREELDSRGVAVT